ncbi:MAG: hypothetical protein B6242_11715 [Anaerolineaceae bacterium 4572_78]|nr:MAG: hypothetical protein B6242_11715 [Anaerolineaceae bacterium 4572_78]
MSKNSETLHKEGIAAFRAGDIELAHSKFEATLEAAKSEENPKKIAEALNDLGVVLKQLEDYDGALDHLENALERFQKMGDKQGEAQALGNLGMVQEAAEEYEDAIQDYLDSAALFEEIDQPEMAIYSWQALSRLKLKQKEWLNAIAAYERAIERLPDSSIKKKILQKIINFPSKLIGT